MFGKTVLGVDGELFEHALDEAKKAKGTTQDLDLDEADLQALVDDVQGDRRRTRPAPTSRRTRASQMDLATKAVFDSWNGDRARLYRRQERIPADLGTAVNVCSMVFGNLGMDSGTGVAFTRDPSSGAQGVYGDYLQNAQGEDVVAGIRNTLPLDELRNLDAKAYDELMTIMATLEHHYRDLCDIEFTIERGKLWMLQTRVGKRTAGAAFRIATQLVDEGLISEDEALLRVSGAQLMQLMFPTFGDTSGATKLTKGMGASPGAAVGKAVFTSAAAVEWAAQGEDVILVRRETNPDDLSGMIAAQGILTSRGGKTSHAAVVARGMGKTCVCGAEELEIDTAERTITLRDGADRHARATCCRSTAPAARCSPARSRSRRRRSCSTSRGRLKAEDGDDLVQAVHRLIGHADSARRMKVRANADTGEDASRARRFGAQGIGLCRTEHMFLGERRQLVETLIIADTDEERTAALAALLGAAARRLRRDPAGDGRPAGHGPADRPAAARVPARPHRADRRGARSPRPRGKTPDPVRVQAARGGPPPARDEPDARPARRPARPGHPRPVRPAGARARRGGQDADRRGPRPAARGDGPARRRGPGARAGPRGGRADPGRGGCAARRSAR